MATPESKVKQDIKAWLDARGVWWCMPVLNGYGRRGIPDFICSWRGRFVAIEAKSEHGDVSAWQAREMHKIRKSGGMYIVAKAPAHIEALEAVLR